MKQFTEISRMVLSRVIYKWDRVYRAVICFGQYKYGRFFDFTTGSHISYALPINFTLDIVEQMLLCILLLCV